MDMAIPVIRVSDQATGHLGLMVLDHMGPDLVHQEVRPGSTLAILVMGSIHPKDGMDQMQGQKVLLHQASQVVLLDTLE